MSIMDPSPQPTTLQKDTISPSLLHAETATITFSAQKDGKLRLRSLSLVDVKVVHPGQVVEVMWGPQGVELRVVSAMRRRCDLDAAIDRASDPYDGDPALAARLIREAEAQFG